MNRRLLTALLLLVLTLAGCLQVRDAWLEESEPPGETEEPQPQPPTDPDPDEPTDPDTDEPTDPDTRTVTLLLPAAGWDLLTDESGANVLERIEVDYQPLLAGQSEAADSGTLELRPGEPASLEIPEGEYLLESRGYGGPDGSLLAFGTNPASVGPDTDELELELEALLGSVSLVPALPAWYVLPEASVGFRLQLWSPVGDYRVAHSNVDAVYSSEASTPVASEDGGSVTLTAPAQGVLDVSVTVTGLTLVDGEPDPAGQLSASAELPVQPEYQAPEDWQAPSVTFDPIPAGATQLSGSASDNRGVAVLRVYAGAQLLGSSDPADAAPAAVRFDSGDPGRWTLDWTTPAGSQVLRAEAVDLNGNSAVAFQAFNVQPPADEGDLDTYTTVGGAQTDTPDTFDTNTGFCPANEFNLPGQGLQAVGAGLQAVGAIGGLFLTPSPQVEPVLLQPQLVAGELGFVDDNPPQHNEVIVMIVDDFGTGVYDLPAELLGGNVSAEALRQLSADGAITHGAMVLHHTLELFAARGYTERTDFTDSNHGIPSIELTRQAQYGSFIIRLINTNGLDTSGIAAALRQAYGASLPLGSLPPGFAPRVVVNMSFVMLPCAVTGDLEASGITTFEEYLQALAIVNNVDVGAVSSLLSRQPTNDDLLNYLSCPFNTAGDCTATNSFADSLVHVASAGNFGSAFTLLPAAADTVIAVSSQDHETGSWGSRSSFSNPGSVMAPGANFELSSGGGLTVSYSGTSFAAPVVTVLTALDLRRVTPSCSGPTAQPGGLEPPELADIEVGGVSFSNVRLNTNLAGGISQVVVSDFCGPTVGP